MQQQGNESSDPTFGFLTTVDSPTHGVFGGYLVVDAGGRPLEFHCTTPLKVSRAQQILYGATLQGHLHGRQIGAALLAEGGAEPVAVLIDSEAMLHVRSHTLLPVALVQRLSGEEGSGGFVIGGVTVTPTVTPGEKGDSQSLRRLLEILAGAVDLCEPFERIRSAIEEAQRH